MGQKPDETDAERKADTFVQMQVDMTERLIRDRVEPLVKQIADLERRVAELERRERENRRP